MAACAISFAAPEEHRPTCGELHYDRFSLNAASPKSTSSQVGSSDEQKGPVAEPGQCVHWVTTRSWDDFISSEISRDFAELKHGNVVYIQKAAEEIAALILSKEHIAARLADDPRNVCIVAPPYHIVPTAGAYTAERIRDHLANILGSAPKFCQMRRCAITNGDFAEMTPMHRRSALASQFYLDESDIELVQGSLCLVIDDSIMYGTHYIEAREVLIAAGVASSDVDSFYYVGASVELLKTVPQVEKKLNDVFRVSVESLQQILGHEQFGVTLRLIKLLLKTPQAVLGPLLDWLELQKPRVLEDVQRAALDEDLSDVERLRCFPTSRMPGVPE